MCTVAKITEAIRKKKIKFRPYITSILLYGVLKFQLDLLVHCLVINENVEKITNFFPPTFS